MPKYIKDVINTINYNSSFDYDFDVLPNPSPQNNAEACRNYKNMIDSHIDNVQKVWFQDIKVEEHPELKFWTLSGPSEGWGDYVLVSSADHGSYDSDPVVPRSLRDVARDEFGVDKHTIADIDRLINLHDRSRYSEDEFYAAANYHFGSGSNTAYRRSLLKHYQRNAHEFTHYMYHREDGPTRVITDEDGRERRFYTAVVLDMPEPYIWCRIAVWLANFADPEYVYNLNNGYNPFQYYWGKDSNYKWEFVAGESEDDPGHWEKVRDYSGPVLPDKVELNSALKSRIELIVDRWSQVIPKPEEES